MVLQHFQSPWKIKYPPTPKACCEIKQRRWLKDCMYTYVCYSVNTYGFEQFLQMFLTDPISHSAEMFNMICGPHVMIEHVKQKYNPLIEIFPYRVKNSWVQLLYTTVQSCDGFCFFLFSLAAQFFAMSPFEPWTTPDKVERVRKPTF